MPFPGYNVVLKTQTGSDSQRDILLNNGCLPDLRSQFEAENSITRYHKNIVSVFWQGAYWNYYGGVEAGIRCNWLNSLLIMLSFYNLVQNCKINSKLYKGTGIFFKEQNYSVFRVKWKRRNLWPICASVKWPSYKSDTNLFKMLDFVSQGWSIGSIYPIQHQYSNLQHSAYYNTP